MKVNIYTILFVCVVAIMVLYVAYYIRASPDISFVQTTIDKIDFETLNSKLPVIILDRIVDVHDLLATVFRYQYTFIQTQPDLDSWIRNSHKFLVIKATSNQKVQIAHPHTKMSDDKYEYIDLVLRKDQVVVMPYGWWVHVASAEMYALDDMLSKLISFVA